MRLSERDPDELLKPAEAARLLGVGEKTLARWANHGRLPSTRTLGGHHRYRVSDVLAALVDANATT